MSYRQEVLPGPNHLLAAVRSGLAVGLSGLAMGGPAVTGAQASVAHPEHGRAAVTLPGHKNNAHQPVFGLSGLALTNPELPITAQPGWNLIAGPSSPYHTRWLRAIVHVEDLVDSSATIQANLNYAQTYLGYKPDSGRAAPVVVSVSDSNEDIAAAAGGSDVCTPTSSSFNLKTCVQTTRRLEKNNLGALMRQFPAVKIWGAFNEPEDADQPTTPGAGGEKLAVDLWFVASKVASTLKGRYIILPGEFQSYPSAYERQYLRDLSRRSQVKNAPKPTAIGIHNYNGVVCATQSYLQSFDHDLKRYNLFQYVRRNGEYVTESGVRLEAPNQCSNAQALANFQHKDVSSLPANAVSQMSLAQYNSAETLLNQYKVDRNITFHIAYYDPDPGSPECWGGGAWDTGLWAPDGSYGAWTSSTPNGTGIPGSPRVSLYVLTHQPVPKGLMFPATKRQTQQGKLTNIPPYNWTSGASVSVGNCHYGSPN